MLDDIDLMRRLQSRDSDALEEMFNRYHRFVFFIVNRVIENDALAEDLTYALFLELWNRPNMYPDGAFVGWLARLSRTRALSSVQGHASSFEAATSAVVPILGATLGT